MPGNAATTGAEAARAARRNRVVLVLTYALLALYMATAYRAGMPMNGDADDLLKLHEIRSLLASGAIFDRTLPGILQPEPFVSHWPWIVDLPYALVAVPAGWIIGPDRALDLAVFLTPLLLLAPALFCYDRLVGAAGFRDRAVAMPLAVFIALPGFQEFAPGRIDYHNLQILLLFASLVLLLRESRGAAMMNGALVALAIAISPEFVAFHLLLMGFYAFAYVFGRAGTQSGIAAFGLGMAIAAAILFAVIVPPSGYGVGRCDSYSAPFALALVLAGAAFFLTPRLARSGGWRTRAAMLVLSAALSLGLLVVLFPQCMGGPYGALDPQIRDYFLGSIGQEKSFLQRGDFVLSESLIPLTLLFMGALAPVARLLVDSRRSREVVVLALFSLLAVGLALAYFRYLRYVPFFAGIGFALIVAALLPPRLVGLARLDCGLPATAWSRLALPLPGLALSVFLVGYHLSVPTSPVSPTIADIAGSGCGKPLPALRWPDDAIVLAPPALGVELLAAQTHPSVVATPHHPAARGMARVARFLDPATTDPAIVLDEARAGFVAVCARKATLPASIRDRYPFATSLMEGTPPSWLKACPLEGTSGLRLYSYRGAPCPGGSLSTDTGRLRPAPAPEILGCLSGQNLALITLCEPKSRTPAACQTILSRPVPEHSTLSARRSSAMCGWQRSSPISER
ncbi:MAG: hypothetical protein KF810_08785 [Rhizobiaceae bacterium]|nr:hypothetical protein [Rhizobiaceae bacterium]